MSMRVYVGLGKDHSLGIIQKKALFLSLTKALLSPKQAEFRINEWYRQKCAKYSTMKQLE